MHPPRYLLLSTLAGLLFFAACRKDEHFTSSPSARLEMSQDTVLFDTIFTTVGSITKRFTVHNRNREAVRVDIALEGGAPSPFRINVDGASGLHFEGVEILGGDSIFIFVEATLDQNNGNNPMVIEDHIRFNTNGNAQSVLLVAWGQDAHFFYPDHPAGGFPAYRIIAGVDDNGNPLCETVDWTNDKPYVIYGYAVVDSCSTLNIHPGVKVYFHGGSGLWVYRYGQIHAEGTPDARITFQGDRLEPLYADLPGQWDRIWLMEGDNDNTFSYCDIKNALVGIQCETAPWRPTEPTSNARLRSTNVSIRNSSVAGILSRNYRINATNLLVADAGQYAVALTGGGEYHFNQTTIANYWNYSVRQQPAFILTNYVTLANGDVQVRDVANSTFTNGIIYGANANEFKTDISNLGTGSFTFDHWLFRTDQATSDLSHFPDQPSIYRNQYPGFIDPSGGDFHIGSGAFARNKGIATPDPNATFDLDNILRGDGQPDLGCYEVP
ncbi:MAG: hypothetical protein QM724_10030 [Flavobacteriales bacterium]